MDSDRVANGCRCWHIKTDFFDSQAVIVESSGKTWYLHGYCYDAYPLAFVIESCLRKQFGYVPEARLVWDKLPTTSQFSVIQAIAELDDTLAMFSKKFIQSLFSFEGLAAFQYGIVPFYNDILAINSIVQRVNSGFADLSYEYSDTYQVNYTTPDVESAVGTWTVHLQGTVSPPGGTLPELLDVVGFHPDLATAWDLVPLSFVVNWFLPIGDWLESICNRGWVNTAQFSGWYSTKFVGRAGYSAFPSVTAHAPVTFYSRRYLTNALLQKQSAVPLPSFHLPSFSQLFNTAYLALLSTRR